MSRDVLKEGNKTHFFLTVKGIGQMIAEKRESSDMRRAKHTTCQLALYEGVEDSRE
jgi:hypothetical protein